ncbi:MAG: 30S ribosomal protein S4e [archaeon]
MSKKGQNKKSKALSAPKTMFIQRKTKYWAIRAKAGPHKRDSAVPLGIVIRDYLGLAKNLKEAKYMMNNDLIKVNGVARRDYQFPVGIFDTVDIEAQKVHNRMVLDNRGRLVLKALKKASAQKICKVAYKHVTAKGIQLTTNDGRIFLGTKAKVGDGLLVKLPEGNVEKVLPLKEGAMIYITRGVHCSEKAKVKGFVEGTMSREKLVKFESKGKEYETIAESAMVIGEGSEAIEDMKE